MHAAPRATGGRDGTLQELRERFRAAQPGKPVPLQTLRDIVANVPVEERPDALVDLVHEHLQRSWQEFAEGPRLEAYIAEFGAEFPELRSCGSVPQELVEAEFLARHASVQYGDHPPLDEYQQRFPGRAEVCQALAARYFDGQRYVRIHRIGQGGLGRVWLAWDFHLERYVALKEPLPCAPNEGDLMRRLATEARITAGLDHPAIVTVHEFRHEPGVPPFYVMRWIQGRSLRESIRQYHSGTPDSTSAGRILWNRMLEAFVTVCDAVAYAHQKGVIHRDLKPDNVVLGTFGGTVLVDWGLAKAAPDPTEQVPATPASPAVIDPGRPTIANSASYERTAVTAAGVIVGAPAYMAPEQARGQATRASDVFGLGAILYEILCGRPPRQFSDQTPLEQIRAAIREGRITPPRDVKSGVPRALEAVCLRALQRQPEDRYRTATELAQDVRRWAADEPVSCVRDRWQHRVARFVRHHGRASIAAAVTSFLILAIGVGAYIRVRAAELREAQRQELESRRYAHLQDVRRWRTTAHAAGWSDKAWNKAREAADIRRDADVRDQAAATLIGLDARPIKDWRFDHPSPDPNSPASRLVQVPFAAFTPDGRRLVLAGSDGQTRVWTMADDELQTFPAGGPGPLALREDGVPLQLVATAPERYSLRDVCARKPIREFTSPVPGIPKFDTEHPAVTAISPDAKTVAAAIPLPGGEATLVVWNGNTGAVLQHFAQLAKFTALALAAEDGLLAAGDQQGVITVWSLPGGQELMRLQADNSAINCLALARDVQRVDPGGAQENPADGWLLAAGDAGGTVTVWDLRRRIPRSYCRGSLHDIHTVAFSPDGMTLASGAVGAAMLWDVATGAGVCKLEASGNRWLAIAFAPDGQRVAFGTNRQESDQLSALVWDLEFGRGIRALRGLAGSVAKVAFSPSGRHLAALSHNWQVGIWSLDQTRLLHRIEVRPGFFVDNADLTFSPDDRRFAFSAGELATIWDVKTGRQVQHFDLPPGLQDCLAFDPSGKKLLLFRFETADAKVGPFREHPWTEHPRICRLRDLLAADHGRSLWEVKEFSRGVHGLRATRDGELFVVDGRQATASKTELGEHLMAVYDGTTDKPLWTLPMPYEQKVGRPVLDALGTVISVEGFGGSNGALLDATSGRVLRFPFPGGCLSPHGAYHAALSTFPHGPGIGLYRTGAEEPLGVLALDDVAASCYQIQFSRDGRLLAWPSRDGAIYVAEIQEVRRRLAGLGLGW